MSPINKIAFVPKKKLSLKRGCSISAKLLAAIRVQKYKKKNR